MSRVNKVFDFTVRGGGTVYTLVPETKAAESWVDEHLPNIEPWQMMGAGIAVEHRYINDIISGIQRDGLTVERL